MHVARSDPLAALCVAGMTLAMVAGCSSGAPESGTGVVEGGPVAYVDELSDSGMEASLRGALDFSRSCVTIVDEHDQRWLPIFQRPRTTWDGTTLTYNGKAYTDGSRISLGGGGVDASQADYVPAACDGALAFIVGP